MHLSSIKAGLGLRPTALPLTALCLALPLLACQKADLTIDPADPPVRQSASFTVNGKHNEVNGDCVSGCIRGEFDGQFTLTITAPGRQTLQLRIRGFAGKTGSFPFTADDATIDYSTGPANPTYAAMSTASRLITPSTPAVRFRSRRSPTSPVTTSKGRLRP